jgi:hypothetical protein
VETKQIITALVKAKKTFNSAVKDKTNPAFRSKYADLSSCIDAVESSLLENGIFMYQHTFECENGVLIETVFLHESGESYSAGKLHVPAAKNDPQGYGSALTYARRYSLMAACGIAPEDDDGNAGSKPYTPPAPKPRNFAKEKASIENASTLADLKSAWMALDKEAQSTLSEIKDEQKSKIDAAEKAAKNG